VTVLQALILAASRGSRLEPVTHHVPKPLIPFWGRPFISYLLERLDGFVEEVVIVDGPGGEIAQALGDRYGDLPLRYVIQPDPLGTGDALLQARRLLRDPFVVMLADTCPPRETIRGLIEMPGDAVLTAIRVDDPEYHLGVSISREGQVQALWTEDQTVDAGMSRVPSRIHDLLEGLAPRKGELRITQGLNAMIEAGDDVRAVAMPGPWLQFGDHESLGGVLRVMRQIHEDEAHLPEGASSVDGVACEGRELRNSLIFGTGQLVNCTIIDSVVYCGTRLEGLRIEREMTAYGGVQ